MEKERVSSYVEQFSTFLLSERRVSQNTFSAYLSDIRQFVEFLERVGSVEIGSVSRDTVQRFISEMRDAGRSARSISRKISSIKLFYKFISSRFGFEDIAERIAYPKVATRLPVYLTEKEVERLFVAAEADGSTIGIRNRVMIFLMYSTGMRVSELVNLRFRQLDFSNKLIRVEGKGGKERMVPVPDEAMEKLKFYIERVHPLLLANRVDPEGYLFIAIGPGEKVRPITRQAFWMTLKRILKKARINGKVSPHSLRHSLATHLLKRGVNIRSLQVLLGHEKIATVQVYTHIERSRLREVYDKKHPRS
jgi:integrase/recombinase XerD